MNTLSIDNLSVAIGDKQLVDGVSFEVAAGELVVILGSNGAGKSTLLKCIAGLQSFQSGAITWAEKTLTQLDSIERARVLSYLPQDRPTSWPIRVEDVVSLGRYAYGVNLGRLKNQDRQAVDSAIAACDLNHLTSRSVNTLSGGEQARVHCARTFAAQSPVILADEPTTSLDPKHQLEVMDLLHNYVHGSKGQPNDKSRSALVILHEPGLAARFADRLIWLKDGRIIANGSPAETLNSEVLAKVYDIDASVRSDGEHPYVEIHKAL